MSEGQSAVWEVRRALDADIGAIAALHADSFADAWSDDEWRHYISEMNQAEAAPTLVLVGHKADRGADALAGIALTRRIGDEAEILTITVARAHRQRGLARRLLGSLIDALGDQLPCRLFLEVSVENKEALGLYAAFGFRPIGARTAYYRSAGGKPVDARILALDLPN